MKLFGFLRRGRKAKVRVPNMRTTQRICAVVQAMLLADGDEFSLPDIARMTSMSARDMHGVLMWMVDLELMANYFPEPVLPGQPRDQMWSLTPKAYKWATQALLEMQAPTTDPTPR